MPQVSKQILINAEPFEIWEVLTRFYKYDLWNPFFESVKGKAAFAEQLKITVFPHEERLIESMKEERVKAMFQDAYKINKRSRFKVRIIRFEENEEMIWQRKSFFWGTYRHEFRLTEIEDCVTEFAQTLTLKGALINMGWEHSIKTYYESGLSLISMALKEKVESSDFFVDNDLVNTRG